MKSLITGAGGFVGPYLVELLTKNGHKVYGIERHDRKVKNCQMHIADILDKKKIPEIIEQIKPDYIFHLAGQSSVEVSWKEPEATMKINVEGTKNLLNSVLKAKIKPKIVVVTSSEIYGRPTKLPIHENHPLKPTSPYGESRLLQEKEINGYVQKYDMNITISRSFPHTGPGQLPKFVCPAFAEQIINIERKKQEPEIKVGNLDNERDFSDVRDVVRAYLLMAEKGEKGETYNVCSGKSWKIKKILHYLIKQSTIKPKIIIDKNKLRKGDMKKVVGSYKKLNIATGWKPEIKFEQTLNDILTEMRKK